MPFRYNPFTGDLDYAMGPGTGTASIEFATDGGSANPTGGGVITMAGGTGITTSGSGSTVTIDLDSPVSVSNGGTGASSLTDGGILLGSGTGAVTVTAQPTNGQVLIGSTGVDPVLATLTAGTNISITDGAGSITINSTASGDVAGPGSSTDNALARWNGTGGDTLQDSTVIVSNNGEMTNGSQPAFLAHLSSADNNVTGDGSNYTLGATGNTVTVVFDQNSDMTTGGVFTAPVTGKYCFRFSQKMTGITSSHTVIEFYIVTSNATYLLQGAAPSKTFDANTAEAYSYTVFTDMDAMDTCTAQIVVSNGTKVIDITAGRSVSHFSGFLVC